MTMEPTMAPKPLTAALAPLVRIEPAQLEPGPRASYVKGRAWFVVFCSATEMHWSRDRDGRGYFPVERRINELSFETYVPVERKKVPYRGRRIERISPVFGPYVFTRFDREADDWGEINRDDCKGVHGILKDMYDAPLRIPDQEIARVQRWEAAGAFDLTKPGFAAGDWVDVKDGPFAGVVARVKSASKHKRIKVWLKGLGTLEIDPCFLSKIK